MGLITYASGNTRQDKAAAADNGRGGAWSYYPGVTKTIGAGLLDLQREINLAGLAFLDFNVLRHYARFAVGGLDLVFAGRDIGDLKRAILAGDGKVGMIENADPGEHPRVDVALELEEVLRLRERKGQVRAIGHLGFVLDLVARVLGWHGMDIMQDGIGILDDDLLASLHGQDGGHILAALLIQSHRRRGGAGGFAADALQRNDGVAQLSLWPDHIEMSSRDRRMQLAACGVVHDRGNFLLLWRRAFKGDGSGNVRGGGDLQRRCQRADHD